MEATKSMNIPNIADFSNDQFDPYDWINITIEQKGSNRDIDTTLSGLLMDIQVNSQDCGDTIEFEMGSLLGKLPTMMNDIVNLGKELDNLKKEIKIMTSETKMMEKNSESDVLSNLKGIQNNMKICKSQLETILEWDQLCSSCQEALSSEDTEMAASVLEDMGKSVKLLSGLPDQSDRLSMLKQFKQELESQLSPKLQKSLQSRNEDQLLSLYKIYCSLNIESTFISSYCSFYASSFVDIWKSSQVESPMDTLQNYYSNLHTMLLSMNESILAIFNDKEEDVLVQLIQNGSQCLSADFIKVLANIPTNHFRHTLEASFSFMEIIAGCISDTQKKEQSLQALLRDWYAYTTTEFVTNEYNEINDLLNRLSNSANEDELVASFYSSLQSILPTFLLSLSNFQDHCFTIGYGILVPDYLQSIHTIFSNIYTHFSTLIERYSTLIKSNQSPQSLLQNQGSLATFNWDSFQNLLSLLLILDQFMFILRKIHTQTTQFLQANQEMLLSAPSASTLSYHSLFLQQHHSNSTWTSSIQSLYASMHTLSESHLLEPLQSNLTNLRTLLNTYIHLVLSELIYPIRSIFSNMTSLSCWSSTDSSMIHSLPSDFILPIGEHMLKIVEQLEIVSSSVNEAFVTMKNDTIIHDLIKEMETYGKQKEMDMLTSCHLTLQNSVCFGMTNVEENDTTQALLLLITRLTITAYFQSLFSINHIKISGSQQLSTDIGYLSNVISAFGLGTSNVITALKEALGLSDPDLSQRLSSFVNIEDDEAKVVQKIAKARGVLAC